MSSDTIYAGLEGSRGHNNVDRCTGGKGGIGRGMNFGEQLVSIREGKKTEVHGLYMKMDIFCRHYCLGQEIANLLQTHHFTSPASLLHVTDAELLEDGFIIGHVAELKRALRQMVGKELDEGGGRRPELYGGIGGRGGYGKKGGEGGVGEPSKVPPSLVGLFAGVGSAVRVDMVAFKTRKYPMFTTKPLFGPEFTVSMLQFPNTDAGGTWIIGGIGGIGGNGTHKGGEGGVGEPSRIPTGSLSCFTKIFGGIGGEGGTGEFVGGKGGTGWGSAFDELLGHADQKRLSAKSTPLSNLPISSDLGKRLREQGFVTVEALFLVTGKDLLEVGGFKRGDIGALKEALTYF
ncbi:hypothetical protein C8R45DRAFT_1156734 [Mycena sanguinolenta]|nr:hypothetical protein C8R45DRAFT_1156734 [Mycena sanguinolenta]